MEADIDSASASARMNRYELGTREPDLALVERLATVLNVPMAYSYTEEDDLAEIVLKAWRLSQPERVRVVQLIDEVAGEHK